MEEKVGVTDLINRIVQVLKRDLYWLKISTQNTKLIEPGTIRRGVTELYNYIYTEHTYILIYSRTKCTDILTY